MEPSIILVNLLYAVCGVMLMYGSYRVIDWLTSELSFPEELKKGNIAVAVFIGSLFIAIAITIAGTLG